MPRRLDWEKARRDDIAHKKGTVQARPETKGSNYPRPTEPAKEDVRAATKRRAGRRVVPDDAVEVVQGRKYRVLSLDLFTSTRKLALKKSRDAGRLATPGWAKPPKKRRKR
jgi:hypothetical protein